MRSEEGAKEERREERVQEAREKEVETQEEQRREVRKEERGSEERDVEPQGGQGGDRVDAQGGAEEKKERRMMRIHCMRKTTCRIDT